jgi:cytochrome P450
MYHTWYMRHRNPKKLRGDDPEVFRPERWLEMKTRPSAYEYPVFQADPCICPGMNIGLLEIKISVVIMLRHFHVRIQDGEQLKNRGYIPSVALKIAGGLPLQMTPRMRAPSAYWLSERSCMLLFL